MAAHSTNSSGQTVASAAVQKKVIPAMPSAPTASNRSGLLPVARPAFSCECDEPEREPDLLLVASLVEKPANLGGLCRTCEALGLSLAFAHTSELLRAPDFRDPFHTDTLELPDELSAAAERDVLQVDLQDCANGLSDVGHETELPTITAPGDGSGDAVLQNEDVDANSAKSNASSTRTKSSKATAKSRRHKHNKAESASNAAGGGDEDVTGATAFRALSVSSVGWLRDSGRLVDLRPDRLRAFLQARRAEGYRVVALEQTDRSVPLPLYQFPPRCVLLLGCALCTRTCNFSLVFDLSVYLRFEMLFYFCL